MASLIWIISLGSGTSGGVLAPLLILGGALAYTLGKGFVPVRKPGKLPADTVALEDELEYGSDTIEMHTDALGSGQKVLLVDDQEPVRDVCRAMLATLGFEVITL